MTDLPDAPEDDDFALRSARKRRILRIVALGSIGLLVVPGAIGTLLQTQYNARFACEMARSYYAPAAESTTVRFELLPLSSAGWQCYADFFDGSSVRIATLGPIPGLPSLRPVSGS